MHDLGTRCSVPHHDLGDVDEDDFIDYQRARAIAAATRLRRFAKAHSLKAFVSLAYDNWSESLDTDTATRHPERLLGKLRQQYKKFPYAIVAEFGTQHGNLHWHWLVPPHVPKEDFQSHWNWGSVDYQVCPTMDDLKHVVKYMRKDFDDLREAVCATSSFCRGLPTQTDSHPQAQHSKRAECW